MNRYLHHLLLLLFFSLATCVRAQELDAKVSINHQQVQGTSTSVFETLQTALEQFVNDRQWTNLQFKRNERIKCQFAITVKKYSPSDNTFQASLYVQTTRPVYGSGYTTTAFAFNDPNFNFTYQEYDQLEFRTEAIDNNLTALMAYYVYMIIGFDMDAMAPKGGTEYFTMAQDIVNNAQGMTEKGWKAFEDSKNRHALITDLLDGGMESFRDLQYAYYREGLDQMAENSERGRAGITKAMELLKKAKDNKTMSMLPQIFTDYKRDELLQIYKGHGNAKEKESIVETLSRINASQNAYWRQMLN